MNENKNKTRDEEKPTCRICLGEDEAGHMIVPCRCKGSAKHVHRECLDNWRNTNPDSNRFTHCQQCRFRYTLIINPHYEAQRKANYKRYHWAILKDIGKLLTIVLVFLIGLTFLLSVADRGLYKRYGMGMPTAIFYFLMALVVSLMLIGSIMMLALLFLGMPIATIYIIIGLVTNTLVLFFILGIVALCTAIPIVIKKYLTEKKREILPSEVNRRIVKDFSQEP